MIRSVLLGVSLTTVSLIALSSQAAYTQEILVPPPDSEALVYPDYVLPEGQQPTVVRNTLQDYTPLPEAPVKKPVDLGNFISDPVTVEYTLPPLDLTSNLPTIEEVEQYYKDAGQAHRDRVAAQAQNYTPAPVLNIIPGGYDYSLRTPTVQLHIPKGLNRGRYTPPAKRVKYSPTKRYGKG